MEEEKKIIEDYNKRAKEMYDELKKYIYKRLDTEKRLSLSDAGLTAIAHKHGFHCAPIDMCTSIHKEYCSQES